MLSPSIVMDEVLWVLWVPRRISRLRQNYQIRRIFFTAAANLRGGISCKLGKHILGDKYAAILSMIMLNEKQY